MDARIMEVVDEERGCGWRKPGGLYMRAEGPFVECAALPIPLNVCPVCGCGVRPSRQVTFVDISKLIEGPQMEPCPAHGMACPPYTVERALLQWIGEVHYPTPAEFVEEANRLGISRRINMVPKGFKVGETWVALAHRKVVTGPAPVDGVEDEVGGAIFLMWKPSRIEVVCTGEEDEETIDEYIKRGLTPVRPKHLAP